MSLGRENKINYLSQSKEVEVTEPLRIYKARTINPQTVHIPGNAFCFAHTAFHSPSFSQ